MWFCILLTFINFTFAQEVNEPLPEPTIIFSTPNASNMDLEMPEEQQVVFTFEGQDKLLVPSRATLISENGKEIELDAQKGVIKKTLPSKPYLLKTSINGKKDMTFKIDLSKNLMPQVLIELSIPAKKKVK
ncbi:MAG: hypothetical protein KDD46_00635 [Bdellovibrionales bacterium]|nr:hypothetical protein [Bdellovibrionales bacterium]MCB0439720.1 hypothetical protein [Mangrovimonas sp.]